MTSFIDTNILLYAVSGDVAERGKRDLAKSILATPGCVFSLQVFNEFVVRATDPRKISRVPPETVRQLTSVWSRHKVQALDLTVFDRAWEVARRTNYSWWDCTIVAAALVAGCDRLLSEDMQHGHVVDSVRIENPFRDLA